MANPPRMPIRLVAALLLGAVAIVNAHEHHMDKIPEGEAVSSDPIVRHIQPSLTTHLWRDS